MSWACDLTKAAENDLRALPNNIKARVARVLTQMKGDPFQGDVKALRGDEWQGVFRRRIGDYRIMFSVDHRNRLISRSHSFSVGEDLSLTESR